MPTCSVGAFCNKGKMEFLGEFAQKLKSDDSENHAPSTPTYRPCLQCRELATPAPDERVCSVSRPFGSGGKRRR